MNEQLRSSRFAQRLSPEEAIELLGPALTVARSGADVVLAPPLGSGPWPTDPPAGKNPFVHYRRLLWSYDVARHLGRSDDDYVRLVTELDEAVEAVDGRGFRVTPLSEAPELAAALDGFDGRLFVKDETNNVSGSHKGRHLFGLALHLEILHRTGTASSHGFRLAIASCGNAALAAAVVAKAIGQSLEVYVPPSAAPPVLERLHELGAEVVVCERRDGELGDPSYLRFLEAVEQGAVPFGCQGPDNGLTLDGGRTIGFELADQLGSAGAEHIFVQVGGGALATGVSDGLAAGLDAGVIDAEPRLHAVQTEGAYPFARAYRLVFGETGDSEQLARHLGQDQPGAQERISSAAADRSAYMRPWPEEPHSAAEGILDDETYDWQSVLRATVATGGWPIVATEIDILRANELSALTAVRADHTGTAGLAGLLRHLAESGPVPANERVVLLFTGSPR